MSLESSSRFTLRSAWSNSNVDDGDGDDDDDPSRRFGRRRSTSLQDDDDDDDDSVDYTRAAPSAKKKPFRQGKQACGP